MQTDEITRLVEEIQQVLASPAEPEEFELIDLAARHDDVVEEVTARLRQVDKLLSRSLRSEAIALAEKDPPLNDLVTALDFPEFEIWNDLLMQFGIQTVRELPLDIAAELNDAYSVSDSLQHLLQKYRTQSLARDPLDERIATLRRLATEDVGNIKWKADVQKFEAHRVSQLKKEAAAVARSKDLDAIAALDAELNGGHWSIKIPVALKKSVREAHMVLRRGAAREELEPLCHDLSDAYADFDQPRARKLQQRFFALSEILDLDETDPLYDIAGPALDWLNEEEARAASEAEFVSAQAALEAELDRSTTIDELERLYHQTTRHGHTLPERLEHRLAERIEALKAAESRRRFAITSSIVGACLVAIVGVVLVIRSVTFNNAVAAHEQQIQQLLESAVATGELQSVDDYFATLQTENPAVLEQPEILGLKERLSSAHRQEDGRRSQFEELISQVLSVAPDTARWESIAPATKALQQAEELVLNESERARILGVRSELQAVRLKLQQETDAAFTAEQEAIVEVLANLPDDRLDGYADALKSIEGLNSRPHVSTELKATLAALKSRVTEQRSMIQANLDMSRSLQEITAAVGKPASYRQALIDYTKEHTGTVRSQDFLGIVREDFTLWEGVEQWNELHNRFRLISLNTISAADAKKLVADFEAFRKTSGPYPGETGVATRVDALKAIAGRETDGGETAVQQVERLFAAKTISQAYMIELEDDSRYYALREPSTTEVQVRFERFTTTTGLQTDSKSFSSSKVVGVKRETPEEWLAPQTLMTRRLLPLLKDGIDDRFEETIAFGVKSILKEEGVDSILRFLLVENLLRLGASGSASVKLRVADHLEQMSGAGVSRLTNWVDPADRRASDERRLAMSFLKTHGEEILKRLEQSIEDRKELQQQPFGPKMQWVGWLHRDAQSRWVVELNKEIRVNEASTLVALGRSSGQPEFYEIATVETSSVGSVAATESPKAKEGHPVYVAVPRGSTSVSHSTINKQNL